MTGILKALGAATDLKGLVDELRTTDEERGEIDVKLKTLDVQAQDVLNQVNLARIELSKTEAQHGSWFVAGARPAGLWCGPILILYSAMVVPIVNLLGAPLEPATNELLMTALGLSGWNGGARTIEKLNGVARSRIR